MDARPIFYDETGRRRRRFTIAVCAFVALILLSLGVFAASIVEVPAQRALPFDAERQDGRVIGGPMGRIAHAAERHVRHALRASWLLPAQAPAHAASPPLAVGFHAPWDDASAASLLRHVDDLDWLVPDWLSVTGPSHRLTVFADPRGRGIIAAAAHRPKLLPMVQNAVDGNWDSAGAAALLHDRRASARLIGQLGAFLAANQAIGIVFDIEELPPSAQRDYLRFLHEAKAAFAPRGWLITVAVPVDNPDWDLRAYARVADRLFVMAYDEHYLGGPAGPIASQAWFVRVVAQALRQIPPSKAIVAIASYAYDWTEGGDTNAISVEQAWLTAHESDAMPRFDRASGNSNFSYDEDGKHHDVWLLDAASAHNQMAALRQAGLDAFALWRLGTEDPAIWQIFGRRHRAEADPGLIQRVPAGTEVDIEGTGEVLKVTATPVPGLRRIAVDGRGLIVDSRFARLPLPYAIQRAGYRPGMVALTFDDGPDAQWTPQILDILKAAHVPATFFIVGENALTHPRLLNRIVDEGHEVGNHTYTHPNLGLASPRETSLELNATQRLFQAFTGRSLRLFRAPYFGDAEPTTADEIDPVYEAQQLGYLSVGLHVDPGDWKRPGVRRIIDSTIAQVEDSSSERSGQIVLLHDAGGDRAQTVAALPAIIAGLRARGYAFVPVSTLIGLSPDQVMPRITDSDRAAAEMDLAMFTTLGAIVVLLHWLFAVAITLGIARAVFLAGLALSQAAREGGVKRPPIDPARFVSVLIPAFNEEKVIEASVRRVLASSEVTLEVIVIDDGSRDATSAVVQRAFAGEPRVHLLTLANGGKARALNQGLAIAKGDIIIALDADTQFEAKTTARLASWFADPAIGAVAGNAKVGNRINLVTRWQALEYITAQNLERRALSRLDAITVVPGAVGAWRAEALRQLGGFPPDTLAEDQDLTIALQRAGWHVRYDQKAIARTEAPETLGALARQRFRWAFGTLQCLWKHRRAIGSSRPRGLGWVGLPQAILFQIGFAAISPVIDLALIVSIAATWMDVKAHGWAQTHTDVDKMAAYWIAFTLIDLLSGCVAFALERRESWRLLWLMIPQRIGYRQVMYYVVLKALARAMRGAHTGWGKLERSGRVAPT